MGNNLTAYTTNSKKTMELFPYALIRLGGDSYENWSALQFPQSNSIIQELYKLNVQQKQLKETLCNDLFDFISGSNDAEIQNIVQNLRRDIYNERKLKNSKISKALEVLPEALNNMLLEYIDLVQDLKSKAQSGEEIYVAELQQGRQELKKLVDSEQLKMGLILSSRTLLNRLDSFQKRPVEKFRKKEHQIEQSLLQYLTRMYAKTSPFSTFTNLSLGTLQEDVAGGISLTSSNDKEQVRGHMRLNNYLLKYLMDLLSNYRQAYMLFPLRCNPTLQSRGDHFLYLTNNNNIESFQRIPFNPVVEHISKVVQEHSDGIRFNELVATLKNDIDAADEELVNYVQQLIGYGMLEYHLGVSGVDPDWDIKLIDALSVLVEHDVKHIDELILKLKQIRQLGGEYAGSGVTDRTGILQKAYDVFREICMKIHEEAGLPVDERKTEQERMEMFKAQREEEKKKQKILAEARETVLEEQEEEKDEEVTFKHKTSTLFSYKPEQIFYEDTTRQVHARLDKQQMEDIIASLHDLLVQMRMFQGNQDEKDKMSSYFLNKYGGDEVVDLLTFYEDYFREFKKPEREQEEKVKKQAQEERENRRKAADDTAGVENANSKNDQHIVSDESPSDDLSILPQIKERNDLSVKWKKAVLNELRACTEWNEDEINIDLKPVVNANSTINSEGVSTSNSYGSFLQFYTENGKLRAVLNGTFPGYGKMISRFLHIFDKKVTEETRSWNTELCEEDTIFVEDCDASYFNANLHPTLMPYEIWMPGGHNSLPADKQIPITDFEVSFNKQEYKMQLRQKSTGKKVHVFDLGFQGHMGRSQLFQLLEKFTKAEYLFTHPLINAVNEMNTPERKDDQKIDEASKGQEPVKPSVRVIPRIVYRDLLVLQRKSWFVPKPLLPQRLPNDSDWQFFQKVNIWRKSHQLPNEVFVYVNTTRWGADNIDKELMKKLTRDDYKPQYIDFKNPLMVSLLEKLIDRVPLTMKLVEMLPSSDQMLKIDDSRYVSEFVVQWYNKN